MRALGETLTQLNLVTTDLQLAVMDVAAVRSVQIQRDISRRDVEAQVGVQVHAGGAQDAVAGREVVAVASVINAVGPDRTCGDAQCPKRWSWGRCDHWWCHWGFARARECGTRDG